ncbi:MAG: hypothetical protein ACXVI9_10070 [Mucilaginibacter sp.]
MNKKRKLIQFLMICINITAIYCMMYHGLTDRFASTFKQVLGYFLLMGILSLNTFILIKKAKSPRSSRTNVNEI